MLNGIIILTLSLIMHFVMEKIKLNKTLHFILSLFPLFFLVGLENGGAVSGVIAWLFFPVAIMTIIVFYLVNIRIDIFNLLSIVWFTYFVGQSLTLIDLLFGMFFYFLFIINLVDRNNDYKKILGELITVLVMIILLGMSLYIFDSLSLKGDERHFGKIFANVLLIFFLYSIGAIGRFKLLERIELHTRSVEKKALSFLFTYFIVPLFFSYQIAYRYHGEVVNEGYFLSILFSVLIFAYVKEYLRVCASQVKSINLLLHHHMAIGCLYFVFFGEFIGVWLLSLFLFSLFVLKVTISIFYDRLYGYIKYIIILVLVGSPLSPLFYFKYYLLDSLGVWNLSIISFTLFSYLPILFIPRILDVMVPSNEI